jgi:hypothetical protein
VGVDAGDREGPGKAVFSRLHHSRSLRHQGRSAYFRESNSWSDSSPTR